MGGCPEDAKVAADTKRMQCNRDNSRRKKLLQTCALQRSAIDNLHRALRLAAQQDYAEALIAFTAASIAGSSALDTEIEGLQELQGGEWKEGVWTRALVKDVGRKCERTCI